VQSHDVEWRWYDPEQAHDYTGKTVSIDIETDYNYQTKKGGKNITQLAVSDGSLHTVSGEHWRELALCASKGQIVGHNSWAFDLPKMRAGMEGVGLSYGSDTMVLAYLLDENQPLGLEPLCVKYLGVEPWKETGHAAYQDREQFALYNARDAAYTLALYESLTSKIGYSRAGVCRGSIASLLLLPHKLALDACSRRGNYVNLPAVLKAEEECLALQKTSYAALQEITLPWRLVKAPPGAPTLFDVSVPLPDFVPEENRLVAKYLDDHGIALPKTATGMLQVDKLALAEHLDEPFIKSLLEYREATKKITTYIETYKAAALTGDGRVHPEYHNYKSARFNKSEASGGTVVGRSSCTNPNVQNINREFKNFICAPKGKVLVQADYKALHIVLFAWVANETTMLAKYAENPKWDPHRFVASNIYEKPEKDVEDDERQIAKSANFGLLYCGDGFTLQNWLKRSGVEKDMKECNFVYEGWHRTFPCVKPFYKAVEAEILKFGYAETPTGRRRHLGTPETLLAWKNCKKKTPFNDKWRWKAAVREAVNYHVLGFEPDIALTGLAACHQAGLPVSRFIHDAVEFEFDSMQDFDRNRVLISHLMCEYPVTYLREHFKVDFTAPLVVDFTVKESY
jgi:DNA polymerase I-like protein with 3'-5' exonuclease and polymerase domains